MCNCFGLCEKEVGGESGDDGPPSEFEGGDAGDGEPAGSLFEKVSREERDAHSNIPGVIGRRRRIRRLHCRTGYDVAVYPNGKVNGTQSQRNKYGLLEFESAGMDGQLRIKGVATGFYITMTPKGRIVGQPDKDQLGTIWIETRIGMHSAYLSLLSQDYAHHGWYLAIKKSGKPKAGHKTNHPYPQKAISFLSRIVAEEYY